jgi:hypothetical protein
MPGIYDELPPPKPVLGQDNIGAYFVVTDSNCRVSWLAGGEIRYRGCQKTRWFYVAAHQVQGDLWELYSASGYHRQCNVNRMGDKLAVICEFPVTDYIPPHPGEFDEHYMLQLCDYEEGSPYLTGPK